MRTFSEEEARAVFARAAREAPADDGIGERLTLDELVEIGRASGLDPERVAAAAMSLGLPAPRSKTLFGMPTEVRRARALPGPLSDAAWEQAVDAMRTLFGGPGRASAVGRTREWSSPSKMGRADEYSVHLSARPISGGGTEVAIEKFGMKEYALSVVLGVVAALLVACGLWLSVPSGSAGGTPILLFMLMAGVSAGLGFGVRVWARGLGARMDAVLDRIEITAHIDAEAPAAPKRLEAPDETRLGITLWDEMPDAARAPVSRTRTR